MIPSFLYVADRAGLDMADAVRGRYADPAGVQPCDHARRPNDALELRVPGSDRVTDAEVCGRNEPQLGHLHRSLEELSTRVFPADAHLAKSHLGHVDHIGPVPLLPLVDVLDKVAHSERSMSGSGSGSSHSCGNEWMEVCMMSQRVYGRAQYLPICVPFLVMTASFSIRSRAAK